MKDWSKWWGGLIGTPLLGVFDPTFSIILFVVGAFTLATWQTFSWNRDQRRKGKPGLLPYHVIMFGLIGCGACFFIVIGGLIWQHNSAPSSAVKQSLNLEQIEQLVAAEAVKNAPQQLEQFEQLANAAVLKFAPPKPIQHVHPTVGNTLKGDTAARILVLRYQQQRFNEQADKFLEKIQAYKGCMLTYGVKYDPSNRDSVRDDAERLLGRSMGALMTERGTLQRMAKVFFNRELNLDPEVAEYALLKVIPEEKDFADPQMKYLFKRFVIAEPESISRLVAFQADIAKLILTELQVIEGKHEFSYVLG